MRSVGHRAFGPLAPLGRRQRGPVQSTRSDIVVVISQYAEKFFVGGDDAAVEIPNARPQDIGIPQAPDPRFAIGEITIKS